MEALLPITKTDLSEAQELVKFARRGGPGSSLVVLELSLPMGLVLEEAEAAGGAPFVVEPQGAAAAAGAKPGDLLRACTACRQVMETPAWQVILGGIGQPKTSRFLYSTDDRPFDEVLEALGSNRRDARRAVVVLERPAGGGSSE